MQEHLYIFVNGETRYCLSLASHSCYSQQEIGVAQSGG